MSASTDRLTASIAKLDTDIQTLIDRSGTAVDALASSTADAVDVLDAKVVAATPVTPAP